LDKLLNNGDGRQNITHPFPDPREIVAPHRTDDDDYKKGLPPKAIAELETVIDYIRYKYKKPPEDKK
jgi:hypothetical protein